MFRFFFKGRLSHYININFLQYPPKYKYYRNTNKIFSIKKRRFFYFSIFKPLLWTFRPCSVFICWKERLVPVKAKKRIPLQIPHISRNTHSLSSYSWGVKNRLAWESFARVWSGSRAQTYIVRPSNIVFSLVTLMMWLLRTNDSTTCYGVQYIFGLWNRCSYTLTQF